MRSSFLQNDKKGIIPLEIAPVIFTSGSLAGPRLPGIIESDLNVRPIAEGLLLGAAASAERIRSPDFSIFSFRVDQGAITFYKEWTVFYNLDLRRYFLYLQQIPLFYMSELRKDIYL